MRCNTAQVSEIGYLVAFFINVNENTFHGVIFAAPKTFLISDLISYLLGPDLLRSGQYYIFLEAGKSVLICTTI